MLLLLAKRSRPACPKALTSPAISTLTSTYFSMASRLLPALLLALSATSLGAQSPAPVRLSFADAIRRATGATEAPPPAVELAGLRTDESRARVTQARSGLLPSISLGGSWGNRTLTPRALGFRGAASPLPTPI